MPRHGRGAGTLGYAILSLAVMSAQAQETRRDGAVERTDGTSNPSAQSYQTGLASPQGMGMPITSIKQLVRLSGPELDSLYRGATSTCVPCGRVRGRVILYPGTKLAVPVSNATRLVWQGKVFRDGQPGAVNRFFGLRMIKANVYQGPSWLDGGPSLILDYSETSRLYAPYRDEIREVAPGIFLGLMYSRTQPDPTLKMYFALESR